LVFGQKTNKRWSFDWLTSLQRKGLGKKRETHTHKKRKKQNKTRNKNYQQQIKQTKYKHIPLNRWCSRSFETSLVCERDKFYLHSASSSRIDGRRLTRRFGEVFGLLGISRK